MLCAARPVPALQSPAHTQARQNRSKDACHPITGLQAPSAWCIRGMHCALRFVPRKKASAQAAGAANHGGGAHRRERDDAAGDRVPGGGPGGLAAGLWQDHRLAQMRGHRAGLRRRHPVRRCQRALYRVCARHCPEIFQVVVRGSSAGNVASMIASMLLMGHR